MKIFSGKRRPAAVLGEVKMNLRLVGAISCIVLGLSLIALSAGVLLNYESTFRWILGKKVVLSAKSQGFPIWKDVSNHLSTRFAWHFFNLTNPEEFKNGQQPILKEVGPFWYNANLTKDDIEFHDENQTVSYKEHRRFEFDAVESVLPESTVITTINVPLMAALSKGEDASYFSRVSLGLALSTIESDPQPIARYTIKELTYEGQANTLAALGNAKDGIAEVVNALTNSDSKKGRFGFAVDKNMTEPGVFNIYTGASGVQDLNRIHSTNGLHVLDMWPTDNDNICNIVDGSLGNVRPPMNESTSQRIFIPDMCRTVTTHFQKDIMWNNIRLRRFNLTTDNFDSSKVEPKNFCYDDKYHMASGVAEVGPCKKGAPIFMSFPHFMGADESFRLGVIGMAPDVTKHEFIMDNEPTTGMTVRVRGRLQANIRVKDSDIVSNFNDLPSVMLPLFWQEMYVEAGPGIVQFLKKVNSYPGLGKIALMIVGLFGTILSIVGSGLLIRSLAKTTDSKDFSSKHHVAYTKASTTETKVDM